MTLRQALGARRADAALSIILTQLMEHGPERVERLVTVALADHAWWMAGE